MPKPMQEASINSALLELRKRTIQQRRPGLIHVEALLRQRGVTMPPIRKGNPANTTGKFVIRRLVLEALRDSPKRLKAIVACVAPNLPDVAPHQAYMRTARALSLMKRRGIVGQVGRVWVLKINLESYRFTA